MPPAGVKGADFSQTPAIWKILRTRLRRPIDTLALSQLPHFADLWAAIKIRADVGLNHAMKRRNPNRRFP